MGIDDQIKRAQATAKAAREKAKRLKKEKRQRLILALGRLVLKQTKVNSLEEFQRNYVILPRPAEPKPRTKPTNKTVRVKKSGKEGSG
jgi:hypothetical protein